MEAYLIEMMIKKKVHGKKLKESIMNEKINVHKTKKHENLKSQEQKVKTRVVFSDLEKNQMKNS